MSRILITGENSFIGKNYIKHSNYNEIGEVSLIENKPEKIDFSGYDAILHLVAIVHQSKAIPENEYMRVNRDLCLATAQKAKKDGVKQFVFLSTIKVYGTYGKHSGVWNESTECHPDDPYGKSKLQAEKELKKLENSNFTVSILRTPLVYGEGVRANMLSIIKLIERFPVLPLGGIKNQRSFTAVENLVAFIDRIIENRASGIFITKDKEDLSTTELTRLIAKYIDKNVLLFPLPGFVVAAGKRILPKIFDRLYGSFYLENQKTLKQLDFTPPLSAEEGLEKMVNAYKRQ